MAKPVDPDADTDKLMLGVSPLTIKRLREIVALVSRAQTYQKDVSLPPDDVLSLVAEVRMRRRRMGQGSQM